MNGLKLAVILAAAGNSKRFSASQANSPATTHKLHAIIAERPVLMRSIDLFASRDDVGRVMVAVDPNGIQDFKTHWGAQLSFMGVEVVPGGRQERWETVRNALQHVPDDCTHVAVHDAARPLATKKLIDRLFEAAHEHPAIVPTVPVSSTLKRIDPQVSQTDADTTDPLDDILGSRIGHTQPVGMVTETVDRTNLHLAQTPQVFEKDLLRRAYDGISKGTIAPSAATDDAAVVQALGQPVIAIEGEATNIKITYPQDLELATAIVTVREQASASTTAKKRLFADDDD